MARLIKESDKPRREDYDTDEDHKADLIHYHTKELEYHTNQHSAAKKSDGWNLSQNIYTNPDDNIKHHKKMMKYHQDELKKLRK